MCLRRGKVRSTAAHEPPSLRWRDGVPEVNREAELSRDSKRPFCVLFFLLWENMAVETVNRVPRRSEARVPPYSGFSIWSPRPSSNRSPPPTPTADMSRFHVFYVCGFKFTAVHVVAPHERSLLLFFFTNLTSISSYCASGKWRKRPCLQLETTFQPEAHETCCKPQLTSIFTSRWCLELTCRRSTKTCSLTPEEEKPPAWQEETSNWTWHTWEGEEGRHTSRNYRC